MWVDGVGRGHDSRHVKPWTHISIPCIAKEALRPTSKTGTDQGDSSHVAVQKLLTLLFPPIAGICRQSMASIMGSQGRTPDRFSRTCPAPFPRRAITVSLEPSPYHPPVHQRSFLFHFYHAALLMAINSASSSVPDSVPGAVENPPEIAGVRTGRRHRRRRQSTRDHKRTQRAPSPAPLAVHPRSQAYAQGTVTGAFGSPPAISGARTGRRHRRRRQSPRGHCKRIRTECGRTAYPHLIHADAPKGGCGFLRIPVGRPTNYPHSMPTSQLPKVSIIPLYQSPFVYSR